MKFREFLQSEDQAVPMGRRAFGQRASRASGIYDLIDLAAALQVGQTSVGGHRSFGQAAQKVTDDVRYNAQYPLHLHNSDASKLGHELKRLSYTQMREQTIDLVARIQAIGSVIASGGTRPGDPDLTARLRTAHFEGQGMGEPANTPGVNPYIIEDVDGRVFYGEVSGRGGTIGFKIGEALRVIVPVEKPVVIPKHIQDQMNQDNAERQQRQQNPHGAGYGNPYSANMSAESTVNEFTDPGTRVKGSHFNINVHKMQADLQLMVKIFGNFERGLQGTIQTGGIVDKVFDQLGRSQGTKLRASLDPAGNIS